MRRSVLTHRTGDIFPMAVPEAKKFDRFWRQAPVRCIA